MRFLRLLNDLVGVPAAIILFIIVVVGNLNLLAALFAQNGDVAPVLVQIAWIAPVTAWLSRASLPNWVFLLVLVGLIAAYQGAYRRLSALYWPQPVVALTPKVETRATPGGVVTYVTLTARNTGDRPITECFATLETAANLGSTQQTPVTRIRNSRLRWAGAPSNDDCTITLPAGSISASIAIADTSAGLQFSACKPAPADRALLGIYVVKIRVDGKIRGSPIEPQYFDGHLYVTAGRKDQALTVLFERGDWKSNRRLPRSRYLRLGGRQFRLPW